MANEQLPTSSTPILVSEPSSAVQTESESSDGSSSDASDDDKPIEQSSSDNVQTTDESEQQSTASDDDDKDDVSVCKEQTNENDLTNGTDLMINELVSNVTAAAAVAAQKTNDDKLSAIDLDEIRYKNLKIFYEGRDILDFSTNVANKSWNVKYAHLPEQNYQMYIQNRSQYNRLAPGYESPENYSLNACGRCAFQFPVMVDIPDENDAVAANACKSSVNDLLSQTVTSIVNSLTQKLPAAQPMVQPPPMHTPTGHSMNNNLNNFNNMLNNNAAANTAQSYPYQNQNRQQFAGNANAVAAAAAAAAAANNHNSFKPNNNNGNGNSNAFYGNNMVLNALVNQIGNNMNNSSVFNSNFMNAINGTNNTTANNNSNNNNTTFNQLNQLSNAALANLMNQQNQRQLYGMCRQNINKSGINFNANSHKQMPTYSHF